MCDISFSSFFNFLFIRVIPFQLFLPSLLPIRSMSFYRGGVAARSPKHASRNRSHRVLAFRPNLLVNFTAIQWKEINRVINLNETMKLCIRFCYFPFSLISLDVQGFLFFVKKNSRLKN